MTELSQMIRWNAAFVRGLAESVLNRAKTIRSSLTPYTATPVTAATSAETGLSSKPKTQSKPKSKRAARPAAKTAPRKGSKSKRSTAKS